MKYSVAKHNAQQFANEQNKPVYITKADKLNDFRVVFSTAEITPHYSVVEMVSPTTAEYLQGKGVHMPDNRIDKNDVTIQLFLKNTLLAEYNNETGEAHIYEPELLPFNLRDIKGINPVADAVKKQTGFYNWCCTRVLNINRANAKKILNALNLSQSEEGKFMVSMACHSVSLNDSYWTKLNVETDLNWDNISLYSNHLSEIIRHIALTGDLTITGKIDGTTPEVTGQGAYAKAWRREVDGLYLYKADGEMKQESKIEVEISNILDCFNVDHVHYDADAYENDPDLFCCKCKCISDEDTAIVPAEHFFTWCNRQGKDFRQEVLKLDSENYYKMLVVDYLVANTDRHIQNWGFFMDNATGQLTGIHPLFDHNNGFDKNAMENEGYMSIVESGKTMKEVAEYAMKRCDFHLVKPLEKSLFKTTFHYETFVKRCKQLGISLDMSNKGKNAGRKNKMFQNTEKDKVKNEKRGYER